MNHRLSEDIDIIVDKDDLGFGVAATPDRAPSNKQRIARLEHSWTLAASGCKETDFRSPRHTKRMSA